MEINRPEVLAEVKDAFARYEKALAPTPSRSSTVFRDAQHAPLRRRRKLHGYAAIKAFRAARSPSG